MKPKRKSSKSKNLTERERAKLARKKQSTRASYLRRKVDAGTASGKDRAELTAWDAGKSSGGQPIKQAPVSESHAPPASEAEKPSAAGVSPTVVGTDAGGASGSPKTTATTSSDDPPKPTPAPPRILPARASASGGGSRGADWRDAYRVAADGREATCLQVAEYWIGGLRKANEYITESGRDPIISEDAIQEWLRPSIILTIDGVLPEAFEVSPPVMVAMGTTAVVAQALVARTRGPVVEHDAASTARAVSEKKPMVEKAPHVEPPAEPEATKQTPPQAASEPVSTPQPPPRNTRPTNGAMPLATDGKPVI